MIVGILNKINFVLKQDQHTVGYAERAKSCTVVPDSPSAHWKAVIGVHEQDLLAKLKAQAIDYLLRMALDPADFTLDYRYTPVDDNGQFWLLGDRSGTYVYDVQIASIHR